MGKAYNVGFGYGSLVNVNISLAKPAGTQNTALGYNCGNTTISGYKNVYIGYESNGKNNSTNNEIAIGAGVTGNGSNTVTIGNNNITETYLKGNTYFKGNIIPSTSDNYLGASNNLSWNKLYVNEIYCDKIFNKNDNNTYLHFTTGTSNTSLKLNGYSPQGNSSQNGYIVTWNGSSYSGWGAWALRIPSDDRLKHNEENIFSSLDLMRKLQPQTYDMTQDFKDADFTGTISGEYIHRAGFIAQEIRSIEEISYCCVGEEYDSSGNPTALTIDYNSIFTHGIAAIKELDNVIVNQQITINELNNKVTTLETENSCLLYTSPSPRD